MTGKEARVIGVRMPKKLRRMIEKAVSQDTHLSTSEYIRDAVREKLCRDDLSLQKEDLK